jgi:hypothetical protein
VIRPGFKAELFTPLRLWLFAIGLSVAFGLVWLKNTVVPATPQIATAQALASAIGPGAAELNISGRYNFSGSEVVGRHYVQLVCGTVGPDQSHFAALVQRNGRRRMNATYSVEELVVDPSPQRAPLPRETSLLDMCAGMK